jgi:hypothetical protein
MICYVERTGFSSTDRHDVVTASEINCGEEWPEAIVVRGFTVTAKHYAAIELTRTYGKYRTKDGDQILVLKD